MRYALAFILLSGCFGPDKLIHAGVGLGVGAAADSVGVNGCAAAIAVGVGKELIDPVFSIPNIIATSVYCVSLLR